MKSMLEKLLDARRVSVPLVAIQTPDAGSTVESVCEALSPDSPLVEWDIIRGLKHRNEAGAKAIADLGTDAESCAFNPVSALICAQKLPRDSVLFFHMGNRFLVEAPLLQGAWNLRDTFKSNRRMLVLLGPSFSLPPELSGDVIVLDEPLPDAEQLARIVLDRFMEADLPIPSQEHVERAVIATQGLPAFAVEQIAAMSLRKSGLDLEELWERKRQQIEQTPGLKVWRGGDSFDQIGGLEVVKGFLTRIMEGHAKPNAVILVDEIEKSMAGARGDTSGVSQDQLGGLLSFMQDTSASGMILIGPPGSGKSQIAKAAGAAGGIPTIQLDLGGLKSSLVGSSEGNLRNALKIISAVSNGKSIWLATCNSIGELPPELRRRFTLGTYFFDLPTAKERKAIWSLFRTKYDLPHHEILFSDEGWTGAEIKQCCDIAWRLGCSLMDASAFIVPVSRSAAEQLEKLRSMATGKFLSASYPGVYSSTKQLDEVRPVKAKRQVG